MTNHLQGRKSPIAPSGCTHSPQSALPGPGDGAGTGAGLGEGTGAGPRPRPRARGTGSRLGFVRFRHLCKHLSVHLRETGKWKYLRNEACG